MRARARSFFVFCLSRARARAQTKQKGNSKQHAPDGSTRLGVVQPLAWHPLGDHPSNLMDGRAQADGGVAAYLQSAKGQIMLGMAQSVTITII